MILMEWIAIQTVGDQCTGENDRTCLLEAGANIHDWTLPMNFTCHENGILKPAKQANDKLKQKILSENQATFRRAANA